MLYKATFNLRMIDNQIAIERKTCLIRHVQRLHRCCGRSTIGTGRLTVTTLFASRKKIQLLAAAVARASEKSTSRRHSTSLGRIQRRGNAGNLTLTVRLAPKVFLLIFSSVCQCANCVVCEHVRGWIIFVCGRSWIVVL